MEPAATNVFYVYALLDPSGGNMPFYVGKGRGVRYSHHYTPAYVRRASYKSHIIRRYRSLGHEDRFEFLGRNLSEREAFDLEIETIAALGLRKNGGLLVNVCLGGEGSSGCSRVLTAEHRAKIAAAHKGKVFATATLAKMSARKKGRPISSDVKAKIALSLAGVPKSDAHRAALSKAASGRRLSPEAREAAARRLAEHRIVKTYRVVPPGGEPITVHNLNAFSRELGFHPVALQRVACGQRKSHRGYLVTKIEGLLEAVEREAPLSSLPGEPDRAWIDDFVAGVYAREVKGAA